MPGAPLMRAACRQRDESRCARGGGNTMRGSMQRAGRRQGRMPERRMPRALSLEKHASEPGFPCLVIVGALPQA